MKKKIAFVLALVLCAAFLAACTESKATDGTVRVKGSGGKTLTYQLIEIGKTDDGNTCVYFQGSKDKQGKETSVCSYAFAGVDFAWEVYIDASITCGGKQYAPTETIPYLAKRPGNVVCFVYDTKDEPVTITVYYKDNKEGAATLTLSELTLDPELAVSDKIAKPTPAPTTQSVVAFGDAALEAKVRAAMKKPEGAITVAEAETVTELNLANEWQPDMPKDRMIKDIGALKHFVNLVKLDLAFNEVSDISVLAGLTKLQSLGLGNNRLGDIGALKQLKNLNELSLFGNGLTDISALAGLTQMNSFFIHANQIKDVSVLANMTKLDMLMMQDNQVTDISPLAALPLTRLYLNNNPVKDFSPIQAIYPKLTEKDFEILSADGVPDEPIKIADPQFEKALRAAMNIQGRPITQKDAFLAQSLSIMNDKSEGSQFADISPLEYFVNLTSLEFNSNRIVDLSPLAKLTKLKSLKIPFNQVVDVTPLAGLAGLERLELNNNQIVDVTPLAGLKNLNALRLRENKITDYSALKDIYAKLGDKDFEIK